MEFYRDKQQRMRCKYKDKSYVVKSETKQYITVNGRKKYIHKDNVHLGGNPSNKLTCTEHDLLAEVKKLPDLAQDMIKKIIEYKANRNDATILERYEGYKVTGKNELKQSFLARLRDNVNAINSFYATMGGQNDPKFETYSDALNEINEFYKEWKKDTQQCDSM